MAQMTAAELHNLHELVWMEAAIYEKVRHYREHADGEHVRKLCDQLVDRTRQHLTALSQLMGEQHGGGAARWE
mgnify:CR=1 FL=1